jgi:2'-5' RNA ligase
VRLFFAIELPGEVRAALVRLRGEDGDYRWVDPASMHVTLAFLGEQPEDTLPRLQQIGAGAASASQALHLRLGKPGTFGPRSAPRVLWVGLEGDVQALQALQSRLADGLRSAGFGLEDRPFSPHITLARRRDSARNRVAWSPAQGQPLAFSASELILFQSNLSPKGATYTALGRFAFGG